MMTYNEIIKSMNILLADDDEDYLAMTVEFFRYMGYNIDIAKNGKEALEMLNKKNYQILLLDYFMPELNGEEVVNEIRKTNQELIIILQTGFAGQKPPIDTMQKLNIQNYHDKTEGIDRLNLELISAVKIFNQQNEIQLAKYRTIAVGEIVVSVAQEIKANLLSVSAGLEVTNMMIQDTAIDVQKENVEKLNKFYQNNKSSLEKVDKVLTSIINQSKVNTTVIVSDVDIISIINAILSNEAKLRGVNIETKVALKASSYLAGSINDAIFVSCELMRKIMKVEEIGKSINFMLTEDESNWYFNISSDKIKQVDKKDMLLIKKVVISVKDVDIQEEENRIIISIKKVN